MPPAHDRPSPARRTVLGALLLTPLAGCGLRLENDAPLPGPKAGPSRDVEPLTKVREWLAAAMSGAQTENEHHAQAVAAMALHRTQLPRLDATLEGLGAKDHPRVTPTDAPAAPASSSSSRSTTSAAKPSTSAPPSAPPSSASPNGRATTWTTAESIWATASAAQVLALLQTPSRMLAMSIAAASLASLTPAHITPHWPSDITMPTTDGALLTALQSAIDALEWAAARTEITARTDVTAQLGWAYAARSLTEAAMPLDKGGRRPPWRAFTSLAQAHDVARKAALAVTSAAAKHAPSARTANETAGMLYVWSGAWGLATHLGERHRPFPGLEV